MNHSPGPWSLCVGAFAGDYTPSTIEEFKAVRMHDYFRIQGANGFEIAHFSRKVYEGWALEQQHANAQLLTAAPAMEMALSLISWRLARIERSTTCPTLVEFCFDGIRYCLNGDWGALINVIGWDRARAAIASAEAKSIG